MKKTCLWCKKEFDYKVDYGSDHCLFCCRDQEHIIFYSDAKRLYKLNDEQLFNNGLQIVKFKMRGSRQICRKFIRNEVHQLADKLSTGLELGHKLRIAYEKVDHMYEEERRKKKELEQRVNNLIDHINSLILKHDITIDIGSYDELKRKLIGYCNDNRYTDQQIVNSMMEYSLSYIEREKRRKFINQQIDDLINLRNVEEPWLISYQLHWCKKDYVSGNKNENRVLKKIKDIIKKYQKRQTKVNVILSKYDKKYKDKLKNSSKCQSYLQMGIKDVPVESMIQNEFIGIIKKEKLDRRKRMLDYRIKKYIPKDKQSRAKTDRLYYNFINVGTENQLENVINQLKTKYI